jgi:hypothetical protein
LPTYAYIAVSTNPDGVGQATEVIMWINVVCPSADLSNDIRWHNYELIITAPDGTNTTQSWPICWDTTSAQDYSFTPPTTGTYTFTFKFPGQTYNFPIAYGFFGSNAADEGNYYEPSSASCTLTVQSTPIALLPAAPLPSAYWTRPIYGENPNWYIVSSNWLGDGAPGYTGFSGTYDAGGNGEQLAGASDVVGSLTGHIMWTKPIESGGVVGGNQTSIAGDTYFEGSAYNQRFVNPIIVDGMLYYNPPISFAGADTGNLTCVDLTTGKVLWVGPQVQISFAYIYDVQDPNQHGVYPPILFTAGFAQAYDAYTGAFMFSESGVPSGTTILGPNGEQLILALTNYGTPTSPNYYLQEWNSSRLWGNNYSGSSTSPPVIPPVSLESTAVNAADVPTGHAISANWAGGYVQSFGFFGPTATWVPSVYDFNVSVPYLNTVGSITAVGAIYNDLMLVQTGNLPNPGTFIFAMTPVSNASYGYAAINIAESSTSLGSIAWHTTLTPPSGAITVMEAGIDPVNHVFVEYWRETSQYVGYSLTTGAKIWGPTTPQADLDYYGSPASGTLANAFAYGNMYSSAYAGIVYCYDTKTGNILWTYGNGNTADNSTNSGLQTPFARYPTFVNAIGNGVVYLLTTEHTIETPIFKGAVASAINATTGKLIWKVSDYTGEFGVFSYAAADGYNTWFNGYDDSIYVVGRGPSETTVTASPSVTTYGDNVVISGAVMDISAGTSQAEQAADFPHGVPVSSDASMEAWMGYVYQQQAEPTNFTGVPVTLSVTDSNGNTRIIGTTTTDENGMFHLTWTPDITGNYTVYADFAGTNGYYGSNSETFFNIMKAPTTIAPTSTPTGNLASNTTVEYGIVATIIVIIVIGAVLAMLTTRKKV